MYAFVLPSYRHDPRSVGGHAVLLVAYDDHAQCYVARNSYGVDWGVDGHFLVRYTDMEDAEFFTDLLSLA
jgi:C1A family cysteine protease